MNNIAIALLILVIVLLAVVAVSLKRLVARPSANPNSLGDSEILLAPIRELLGRLDEKINVVRTDTTNLGTSVSGQLAEIVRQNEKIEHGHRVLGETTARLGTALAGTGVRGNWGQVQLRRVVEMAGLTKHVTYVEQADVPGEDGKLKPDMIVKLPDGKTIVVDAKAPALDVDGTVDYPKQLVKALRDRIKELSGREYSRYVSGSVDFTILFVPAEGTLATALNTDPDISEVAIQQNVLIATPLTLLAMLRAVEYGWKQHDQAENAQHIANEAAELLDRITTFLDFYNQVGTEIKQLLEAYNKSVASATSRLVPQAKKVKELGLAPTKKVTEPRTVEGEPRALDLG